ncbi:hypothetical protein, partial [Klebsiella grimontii]|uniref:hypothetical protein n=1 Tax=Klebsiella grimontii TaxID=2058152 RepID=UPI001F14B82D
PGDSQARRLALTRNSLEIISVMGAPAPVLFQHHDASVFRLPGRGRLHDDVLSPGDKNARHQHENPAQGLS